MQASGGRPFANAGCCSTLFTLERGRDSKKCKGRGGRLANLSSKVLELVECRSVGHSTEEFVKRACEWAWRVFPA